jgi:hypothetical protein
MKKNTTEILNNKILKSDNIEEFLEDNKNSLNNSNFCNVLYKIIEEKELSIANALKKSLINSSYGYQIFNGRRIPSRDKVIQLILGLNLSLSQGNNLLKLTEKSPLYVRNERDAIFIYAINKKMSLIETEELLIQQKCDTLLE